jgi:hypothetical protein
MRVVGVLLSIFVLVLILVDAFESIVLPRRVTRPYRFARMFFRSTWRLWRALGTPIRSNAYRESFYSFYGPLFLLMLFIAWMVGLMLSFAALHWSLGTPIRSDDAESDFLTYVYFSGTTLFTLGYGDVTPTGTIGRMLSVFESGLGLGFLALVIGYFPVFYQATSRREVSISLLDARAGSPPSAAQFLLRLARSGRLTASEAHLAQWEHWSAELLESHLSFPVLSYYRSQHGNQSWLAALTTILDSCALLIAAIDENNPYQAQLTFATARHAAVDLALVFSIRPQPPARDRLPLDRLTLLKDQLTAAGVKWREGSEVEERLKKLRNAYEPFVNGLASYLSFEMPSILPDREEPDNWQRSAWMPRPPGIGRLPTMSLHEHFG